MINTGSGGNPGDPFRRIPGRRSRPFGMPNTPFDPATGTFFAPGYPGHARELTVVEAGTDALLCLGPIGRNLLVAKPAKFRKSTYDGETLDGITYAWVSAGQRTASWTDTNAVTVTEDVDPYLVGETILCGYMRHAPITATVEASELTGVDAGDYSCVWVDLNNAGRRWIPRGSLAIYSSAGNQALAIPESVWTTLTPWTEYNREGMDLAVSGSSITVGSGLDGRFVRIQLACDTTGAAAYEAQNGYHRLQLMLNGAVVLQGTAIQGNADDAGQTVTSTTAAGHTHDVTIAPHFHPTQSDNGYELSCDVTYQATAGDVWTARWRHESNGSAVAATHWAGRMEVTVVG